MLIEAFLILRIMYPYTYLATRYCAVLPLRVIKVVFTEGQRGINGSLIKTVCYFEIHMVLEALLPKIVPLSQNIVL